MANILAGDVRKGYTIDIDGKIYVVVDFMHVKPGKGAAFVHLKLKNIVTGQVIENNYNPSTKFEQAHIERKNMQYSYNDSGIYYFMDNETFEMTPLDKDAVLDVLNFIKEEMNVTIQFYKDKAFSVVPPTTVELEVVETEPGIQGDTSKAGNKTAKLETGFMIQVPLFVNIGDKIRVDTRDGTYIERVKN